MGLMLRCLPDPRAVDYRGKRMIFILTYWSLKEAAFKTSHKAEEIRFRKTDVTSSPSYVKPRIDIKL